MAKRVRTTVTVREDNPVPRRRRNKKKKVSGAVILIVIAILIFLVMNRSQHAAVHGQHWVTTAR